MLFDLEQKSNSSSEYLYPLPKNWIWERFGSFANLRMGKTILKKDLNNEGIPVYSATQSDSVLGYLKSADLELHRDDLVIPARGNSIGYVTLIKDDVATCTQTTICATNIHNILPKYLFHCCYAFKSIWFKYSGSAIPQVTVKQMESCILPLPPLPEQKRIVALIESLFSRLDEARAKAQEVIDGFEPWKSAILHKAFTGQLVEQRPEEGTGEELYREIQAERQRLAKKEKPLPEIKEDEIPFEIPEGWIWTKLANVAKWGSGGTPSRRIPSYYTGTIPWIKSGELNNNVIYETEEHITEEAIVNSNAKLFPVNTVIIAMYGATIGKVGIMGIPSTTNQACACAACRNSLNHMYLYFYAISQRENFINRGKGGAQPNISQEILKDYPIPIPPLAEQKRIVSKLDNLFSQMEEAIKKAKSVIEQIDVIKKSILAKAFRGELGTNDPTEESALEILKSSGAERKKRAS